VPWNRLNRQPRCGAPGGTLLGTVYVDISDEEWAVAIAYGRAQHPKLRGPEPAYEVRYAHLPGEVGGDDEA